MTTPTEPTPETSRELAISSAAEALWDQITDQDWVIDLMANMAHDIAATDHPELFRALEGSDGDTLEEEQYQVATNVESEIVRAMAAYLLKITELPEPSES